MGSGCRFFRKLSSTRVNPHGPRRCRGIRRRYLKESAFTPHSQSGRTIPNMAQKATVPFIFCLWLLGGSPVYAQNRYSQAAEIDDSEFLSAVKEVSLDLRSDDSLAQYISLAAQRNEIVSVLAGYGIAVRPNAQVTLAVRVTDHRPVVEYRN